MFEFSNKNLLNQMRIQNHQPRCSMRINANKRRLVAEISNAYVNKFYQLTNIFFADTIEKCSTHL